MSLKNRNVRQCNRVACGASFSLKIFLIILGCIWFEVSYSVYQFIGGVNDSRKVFERSTSVDIIWVTRRDLDSADHTIWIKQSLPKRYVCVGCQLNSDQALKLLCLKGHVRVCDSTLWRYRWQEASEFLCTKLPLSEGVEQPKKSPKNPENAPSDALLLSRVQNFAADAAKKLHSARFFESSRGFNYWINLGPKILRSYFLHWLTNQKWLQYYSHGWSEISAQHEFLKPIYLCVHRDIVLIYLEVHQKCQHMFLNAGVS